jgi:hypothetical protein
MAQENDKLLQALVQGEVEFVLVEGVAANLHGSSQLTKDLDVVVPLNVDNCRRILNALGQLRPRFYQAVGKPPVQRSAEELAAFKNLYLETDWGRIDLLGSLPPVGDFVRVASQAMEVTLGNISCRVVSLDDLITVKAFVARPKDKLVEMELRAVRDRLREKGSSEH